MGYDVFISYRRDKGAFIARNLQQALTMLGLKVFFDMEELTDGKFNEKLYDAIEESKNVIFLMTEGALNRCVNDGDWVRNELEHVMARGVNLIPISPTGTPISFPEGLPETLKPMEMLEISELNLEKLFKESVAKIAGRLQGVTIVTDKERQEAEEAFISQATRFKGNDGTIDADERKMLDEMARELGISAARKIVLIEKVEREYTAPMAIAPMPELTSAVTEVVPSFDIFISYRRDGGAADARLMYDRLAQEGYSVSFDMDTLKNGNFNEELLRRVAECRNFIILLSKGCFDRTLNGCKREDDWMRIELATALYNNKNIITVMLPGFEFPEKLPSDIDAVRFKNGPKYDLYYLDSFYDRLKKDFLLVEKNEANQEGATPETELSVDAPELVFNDSLDEIFGDDSAYWREEAKGAYFSISRAQPYDKLSQIDAAWEEAEENLSGGDHKLATRRYIEVIEYCARLKPCPLQFITRIVGDGIDPHKKNWFTDVLRKAQDGDPAYQYGVGVLYTEGIGVAKESAAAFRWYERAAASGHVQALSAMGAAYAVGLGVEVNYKAAKRALSKAERKGDIPAVERMGYLYENGFGVRKSLPIALMKYQKAAEHGNSAAMVALGHLLEQGIGMSVDLVKAAAWYRAAVANGSAVAQRKLAEFLLFGKGVEADAPEAIRLARLAANQGDADAVALLGRAYEEGLGIEQNREKAEELYRKAADQGSVLGKSALANLEAEIQYRNGMKAFEGKDVPQDFVAARAWFEKAAAQGHVAAIEELGLMCERGLGGEVELLEAKKWYEQAAEKGNAPAMVGLGRLYFRGYDGIEKNYATALEWFKKAAILWRTTDPANQWKVLYVFFYLGRIYVEGLSVEKDRLLGLRSFLVGANLGNSTCAHSLAVSYERGTFTEKSPENAKRWYAKCAESEPTVNFSDDLAMRVIGHLYMFGDGVEKDEEVARLWHKRAAALGNVQSLISMGKAYRNGRGVPKNINEAIRYYLAAAERGSAPAQNSLSWIYYTGKDVPQDLEKAFSWASKAAKNGSAGAMETLHRMYRDGDGVEKDDVLALEWLQKGAEKGNAAAMSALAFSYETGALGLEVDLEKAVELYRKAAKKKDTRGMYALGQAFRTGSGVEKDEASALLWLTNATYEIDRDLHYDDEAVTALGELYFADGTFSETAARLQSLDSDSHLKALRKLFIRFRMGGRGVEKDISKALMCLMAAAEGGQKSSQNSLGWAYYQGRIVPRDPKKAFEWTMKAVKNGDPNGMETLFRMYRDGDGVEKDEAEAFVWLKRSADGEENSATAVAFRGETYEFGQFGEARDLEKAFRCYYRASQRRNTFGMYKRARCYLYGIGTTVDLVKAKEWLVKAAEDPDDDLFYDEKAMELLIELYRNGEHFEQNEEEATTWQEKLTDLRKKRQETIPGYANGSAN